MDCDAGKRRRGSTHRDARVCDPPFCDEPVHGGFVYVLPDTEIGIDKGEGLVVVLWGDVGLRGQWRVGSIGRQPNSARAIKPKRTGSIPFNLSSRDCSSSSLAESWAGAGAGASWSSLISRDERSPADSSASGSG